jgi:predicted nucleic acid-binding protein
MLQFLPLLVAVQIGTAPDFNIKLRERILGPTPVTDKDLRPQKAPDCRNEAEIQRALEQLSHGEPGECFIRDIKRLSRSRT